MFVKAAAPVFNMSVTESFLSFYDHLLNSTHQNVTHFVLPETLRKLTQERFSEDISDHTDVSSSGRQFGGSIGGCNDAYSAFGFLSFLFALLTFIQNNGGRRKRSTHEVYNKSNIKDFNNVDDQGDDEAPEYNEAVLASALMYQGYLNSLHSDHDLCPQLAMCEARIMVSNMGGAVARAVGHLAHVHAYR